MPDNDAAAREQYAWGVLQQTYLLSFRSFEMATAKFGLSHPQTAVLNVLRHQGRALPLSQIARFLCQEAQSTTELADRLEKRGFVRRIRDARDRRLVLLELTDEGNTIIEQIVPALAESGQQVFGSLENGELSELITLLERVRDRAADRLGMDRERLRQPTTPS